MYSHEKCPYYILGVNGKKVCSAPEKNNAPLNGSRLEDCEYTSYTNDSCSVQVGALTSIVHLIYLDETSIIPVQQRVYRHEIAQK